MNSHSTLSIPRTLAKNYELIINKTIELTQLLSIDIMRILKTTINSME